MKEKFYCVKHRRKGAKSELYIETKTVDGQTGLFLFKREKD
ncbi:hypothetical protein LCGC14_0524530 [marine sediment metagenome]|uniref:Uncharacterized protein n=1 Tax=marine sediment metagenome TaxID=412755 RepID=A0A0F9V5I9_9ZZZZ